MLAETWYYVARATCSPRRSSTSSASTAPQAGLPQRAPRDPHRRVWRGIQERLREGDVLEVLPYTSIACGSSAASDHAPANLVVARPAVLMAFAFQGTRGIWSRTRALHRHGINMLERGDWLCHHRRRASASDQAPIVYWPSRRASACSATTNGRTTARRARLHRHGLLVFGLGRALPDEAVVARRAWRCRSHGRRRQHRFHRRAAGVLRDRRHVRVRGGVAARGRFTTTLAGRDVVAWAWRS